MCLGSAAVCEINRTGSTENTAQIRRSMQIRASLPQGDTELSTVAIIQNANSVQYRSYSEKVSTSVYGRYFSLIVSAICRDGLEGFLLKLNQELYSLQVPKVDEAEERLRNRRYLALIGKLNELSDDVAVGSIQGLRGLCYDRYKKIQLKKE